MEKLWDETDLAEFLKQSVLTVRRVRTTAPSRHPPYIRIGSSVRYDPGEVKRWLGSRTVNAMDAPAPAPVSAPKEKRPKTASAPPPSQKRGRGRPSKAETVKTTKNAAGK